MMFDYHVTWKNGSMGASPTETHRFRNDEEAIEFARSHDNVKSLKTADWAAIWPVESEPAAPAQRLEAIGMGGDERDFTHAPSQASVTMSEERVAKLAEKWADKYNRCNAIGLTTIICRAINEALRSAPAQPATEQWAHDKMSHAQQNVVALLETKLNYDPCPAIKESNELLAPAWEVYEAFARHDAEVAAKALRNIVTEIKERDKADGLLPRREVLWLIEARADALALAGEQPCPDHPGEICYCQCEDEEAGGQP
jgi:hypothetical protein